MMYGVDLVKVGDLLVGKARLANKETEKHYGADHPSFKHRLRFISQISFVRDLGIRCEVATNEEPGKELYTGITIFDGSGSSHEWTI